MTTANVEQRRRWNSSRTAEVWPKRERMTATISPVLLDSLGLAPVDRVVDVGCGGGVATLLAAERVGAGGDVLGVDLSEPLVALARARAEDAGLANLRFQVADAQTDAFGGGPFTVAMSQFGVMFFDDPVAAFANVRAQLVRGGRFGFVCWQRREKNPAFLSTVLDPFLPPPMPQPPGASPTGPFAFADADRVQDLLIAAGFSGVAVARHESSVDVPEDTFFEASSLAELGVPEERRGEALAAVMAYLAPFRIPSGRCRFPLAFQIFTAVNGDPG